jgi:uncharacterized protein (TIGR03086 family)
VATDDSRPLLFATLDQAAELIAGTDPAQAGLPTPCAEWDVATLIGHLCGLPARVAMAGDGGDPEDVPPLRPDLDPADWATEFSLALADARSIWAEDGVLDRPLETPGGGVPLRVLGAAYAAEVAAHTWDLARATGRLAELDAAVGAAALAVARQILPADRSAAADYFDPPVDTPDGADPWAQLAAWTGRDPVRPLGSARRGTRPA